MKNNDFLIIAQKSDLFTRPHYSTDCFGLWHGYKYRLLLTKSNHSDIHPSSQLHSKAIRFHAEYIDLPTLYVEE